MFRSASRVIAAVLGSTALAAAAVLPAAAAGHPHDPRPQRSSVVLGAIQYDSPGRDDGSRRSLNAEWVTVRNTGRHAVNLRGWTLSEGRHQVYRFGHLVLRGHQSVRVHTGHGRDTHRDVYQDRRNYVWDNRSDTAVLRNDHRHVVDTESWGRHHGGGHGHGHGH
ncbi:lamin tail domain-containing protein [Streptomyces sp. NPDC048248]|uniref:lamin tail domain-containing protein n=1 Tax=Streptomyces sp. NPDC048248 TaxID=3365523 RepID=UPI003713799E